MKKIIYISICLSVIGCSSCNNNKAATTGPMKKSIVDITGNAVAESSKENDIKHNDIKRIELFSRCTDYEVMPKHADSVCTGTGKTVHTKLYIPFRVMDGFHPQR